MTLTHHESAESYLTSAESRRPDESQHFSNLATAHGILALIELIQNNLVGDEEAADSDPEPWHVVENVQQRDLIANLESQLDGARAVARNHEATIEELHKALDIERRNRELRIGLSEARTNDGKDTNG